MENPFEIIEQRLYRIEQLLTELVKNVTTATINTESEEILTVEELSEYLTIARQTIYGKCAAREIPYYKNGKRLYFKKKEINKWLEHGMRFTKEELTQQAEEWIRKHPRK